MAGVPAQRKCECSEPPVSFPWFPWRDESGQHFGPGRFQGLNIVAEGAANVVYEIKLPPDHADFALFEGKLLRLRKDLPHCLPIDQAHREFLRVIHTRICDEWMVHQRLIRLPPSLIGQLNQELRRSETGVIEEGLPPRPPKRHGVYLADDEFGLLITDMSAGFSQTLIEFKPKWLHQSPSAPGGSIRCRNCARRAHAQVYSKAPKTEFASNCCPLSLNYDRKGAAEQITNSQYHQRSYYEWCYQYGALSAYEKVLLDNIENILDTPDMKDILAILWRNQVTGDPSGIIKINTLPKDFYDLTQKAQDRFRAAMTFRDCTVYIRFTPNLLLNKDDMHEAIGIHQRAEIRIGDLDLKSPVKAEKWLDDEQMLIDGGWYEGKEVERLGLRDLGPMTETMMADIAFDCFLNRGYHNLIRKKQGKPVLDEAGRPMAIVAQPTVKVHEGKGKGKERKSKDRRASKRPTGPGEVDPTTSVIDFAYPRKDH